MTDAPLTRLDFGGTSIAYRLRVGDSPTLIFLPGYASDMEGTKALALDAFAAGRGLSMLRFDYSGTGSSGGEFERGSLDRWLGEALHLMDELTDGPVVLVGSSMGGWIGLLAARERPERVAAFVGIAAAPDFTEWGYNPEEKAELMRAGRLEQPNPYAPEPQVTHRPFWESGQELLLLGSTIAVDCPVRLIHGEVDAEVPVDIALKTMRQLRSPDVQLTIVKGGGHRLSEPHEIRAILSTVAGLLEQDQ